MKNKQYARDIFYRFRDIDPKEWVDVMFELKRLLWGETRASQQEDILNRYDNEEYWIKESEV